MSDVRSKESPSMRGHKIVWVEIDTFPYLPSSRQLQRKFNGVPAIRQRLELPILDFTRGDARSKKASLIGKRGLDSEKKVRDLLIRHFGEIFVHEQKPFNDYSGRLDFFIYGKDKNFGVDVFFASDRHNLIGCVNNKQRLYQNINFHLIFLQTNPLLTQVEIDLILLHKIKRLLPNVEVMCLSRFQDFIKSIEPLWLI